MTHALLPIGASGAPTHLRWNPTRSASVQREVHTNRTILLLTLAIGMSECAGTTRYAPRETSRRTAVVVANHNWATAKVYLISRDLGRIRLATAETESEQRVFLPRMSDVFGSNVGFEVELVGSTLSYQIDPVMLSPGTVMRVTIHNALSLSNVTVMP